MYYTYEDDRICVTWAQIELALGRPHNGVAGDDRAVVALLLEHDAPAWAVVAQGEVDEHGWMLLRPPVEVSTDDGPCGPYVDYWDHETLEIDEAVGEGWDVDYTHQIQLATGQYRAPLVRRQTTYTLWCDGDSERITADDLDDARAQAEDWAREGDWDTRRGAVWVDVAITDDDGDTLDSVTVQIDQPEPACDCSDGHDWIEGQVQGHGGGVVYTDRCRHCGLSRTTDTWASRPDNGTQGWRVVSYRPLDADIPDNW